MNFLRPAAGIALSLGGVIYGEKNGERSSLVAGKNIMVNLTAVGGTEVCCGVGSGCREDKCYKVSSVKLLK